MTPGNVPLDPNEVCASIEKLRRGNRKEVDNNLYLTPNTRSFLNGAETQQQPPSLSSVCDPELLKLILC